MGNKCYVVYIKIKSNLFEVVSSLLNWLMMSWLQYVVHFTLVMFLETLNTYNCLLMYGVGIFARDKIFNSNGW